MKKLLLALLLVSTSALADETKTIYTTASGYFASVFDDKFNNEKTCTVFDKNGTIAFRKNGDIQVYYKFRYFVPKSLWVKLDEAEPTFSMMTTKQTLSQTVPLPVKSSVNASRLRLRAMSPTYNYSEDDINLDEVREALAHCEQP